MAKKSLGQNFLINHNVAIAEAAHATGKVVLEMGPGHGILTRELCKNAKQVIAIEKDSSLMPGLKAMIHARNLTLINKDFFDASDADLHLTDVDIMISNIPYNLSSKTIEWLSVHGLEAILCLQKEFVQHMLAKEGTGKYSKLSVISSLRFSVTKIMDVAKGNFRPVPKVDSTIIYIKPKPRSVLNEKEVEVINALMQHKKKNVRKALIDSHSVLHANKRKLADIGDSLNEKEEKLFKLKPSKILSITKEICKKL